MLKEELEMATEVLEVFNISAQRHPGPGTDERTNLRNSSGGGEAASVTLGDVARTVTLDDFGTEAEFRESLAQLSGLLPAHERTPRGHATRGARQ